jgi:MHS family alpha-ketoglutarate permease-like MFS transporter
MSAAETGVDGQGPVVTATGLSSWARLKAILGGSAGNFVEWYDWFAYSSFSIYFAKVFFPEGDTTTQFMQTAGVFALGFLARPVGAWIMGLYADRAGRRAALSLSVGLMCLGSLVIACTPGHAQIGIAAPIILLAARILQGLSVGGEYGASATYMSEMAGKKRRGFWSSFQFVTLVGGQLAAALVLVVLQQTLGKEALEDWGWRIPFIIGALLAVVVFWIRRGLNESASFTNAKERGERATTMLLFTKYPRETMTIIGLTAAGSLGFYAYTTYMLKFLVNTAGFSKEQAGAINFATLVGFMFAQPLMGWMSDKLGRRAMLAMAFGGGALLAWPIFTTIGKGPDGGVVFALVMLSLLLLTGYTSVSAVVKAELFPTHVRALGVALPYAIANAIFGGTAEYVALWFKREGMESGFYIYLSVVMAVACVIALTMRDTIKHSLIHED